MLTHRCAVLALCLASTAEAQVAPVSTPPQNGSYCFLDRELGKSEQLVVDLRLRSQRENRRPSSLDSAFVLSHGGRILHAFQVAVLRVAIDTGGLRQLIAGGRFASMAYVVADTTRLDVAIDIFFDHLINSADTAAITMLGGSIWPLRYAPPRSAPLTATVPDGVVPRIAMLSGVTLIRAWDVSCVITTMAEPRPGASR